MLMREETIKRFMWGISILEAYLHFNNANNYTDINIISEDFMLQLLNILYGYDLKNANMYEKNNQGYDLISEKNKVIIQVSTSASPKKVKETIRVISRRIQQREKSEQRLKDLNRKSPLLIADMAEKYSIELDLEKDVNLFGYTLLFVFLVRDSKDIRKYKGADKKGFHIPSALRFNPESGVLDFESLVKQVHYLLDCSPEDPLKKLDQFMCRNSNLFIRRVEPAGGVDDAKKIINEYAENFINPLFLHQYNGSRVTLKNLFVEPKSRCVQSGEQNPTNVVELLDQFLWEGYGREAKQLLLIEGDAAIGKTSLISWLCYHYEQLDEIGKSIFCGSKLVCVRLRELEFEDRLSSKAILQYLNVSTPEEFEERFKGAVIILDGADELSMVEGVERTAIEEFLLSVRRVFRGHKIIITSRPKFINTQLIMSIPYQHYVLLHFDKKCVMIG